MEDLGNRVLVIKHDARKVAIDSVVDVSHVAGGFDRGIINGTASNDVARNGEGGGNVETARLGNDIDATSRGKILGQSTVKDASHLLKGLAGEATANVESSQVKSVGASLLEDGVGVGNGLVEGCGIGSARSHMEAHADDVEAQLLRQGKEALGSVHGGTELHAETAQARGVISHDAKEELSAGEQLGDLVELISIVKGHLLDTN